MSSPQPRVEVHNHYDMHGMPGMQGMHCRHGGFGSMMGPMMASFGGAMAFGMLGSMMSNPGFGFGFGGYPRFF